jgi:hypothetical protein
MPDRYIEMTWACSACAERNLGRHVACQRCGKAKTNEEYEMPADVEQAASVQDAELLRMAAATAAATSAGSTASARAAAASAARASGAAPRRGLLPRGTTRPPAAHAAGSRRSGSPWRGFS